MAIKIKVVYDEPMIEILFTGVSKTHVANGDTVRFTSFISSTQNTIYTEGTVTTLADGNMSAKMKGILITTTLSYMRVVINKTATTLEIDELITSNVKLYPISKEQKILPSSIDFRGTDYGFLIPLQQSKWYDIRQYLKKNIITSLTRGVYLAAIRKDDIQYVSTVNITESPQVSVYRRGSENLLGYNVDIKNMNLNLKVKVGYYTYEKTLPGPLTDSGTLPFYANGILTVKTQVENVWGYVEWTGVVNIPSNGETIVNLYTYSGDVLTVKKYPGALLAIAGKIKNSFNISEPVIDIELKGLPQYNYCFIPSLNRFYFIERIESITNNVWRIHLVVDVLMSWSDDVLNQPALVSRNEFEFNDLLVDEELPCEDGYTENIITFNSFKSKVVRGYENGEYSTKEINVDFNALNYVIVCISNDTSGGATLINQSPQILKSQTVIYMDSINFNYFIENTLMGDFWAAIGDAFQNHSDFLLSTYISPFPISNFDGLDLIGIRYTDTSDIKIGKKSINANSSTITGKLITSGSTCRIWSKMNKEKELNSFVDREGFSKYILYLPYVGTIEVDPFLIYSYIEYVVYDIDIVTGKIVAWASDHEPTIQEMNTSPYRWEGELYTNVPIGSTNQSAVHLNSLIRGLTMTASLASSVGKTVAGVKKGSSMLTPKTKKISAKGKNKIKSSIISGATSFGGTVFNSTLGMIAGAVPSATTSPTADTPLRYRDYGKPLVYKFTPKYYYPDKYSHYFGKPLDKYVNKLSELKGFTKVGEVHLKGFYGATLEEREEIEELLLSGVIL